MAHHSAPSPNPKPLGLKTIEAEGHAVALARAKHVVGLIENGNGTMPQAILQRLDRQTASLVFRELARRVALQKMPDKPNRASRLPNSKATASAAERQHLSARTIVGWSKKQKPRAGYLKQAAKVGLWVGTCIVGIAIGLFEFLIK